MTISPSAIYSGLCHGNRLAYDFVHNNKSAWYLQQSAGPAELERWMWRVNNALKCFKVPSASGRGLSVQMKPWPADICLQNFSKTLRLKLDGYCVLCVFICNVFPSSWTFFLNLTVAMILLIFVTTPCWGCCSLVGRFWEEWRQYERPRSIFWSRWSRLKRRGLAGEEPSRLRVVSTKPNGTVLFFTLPHVLILPS